MKIIIALKIHSEKENMKCPISLETDPKFTTEGKIVYREFFAGSEPDKYWIMNSDSTEKQEITKEQYDSYIKEREETEK